MVAFFIKDLDVKGGTHKQFLYLLKYMKKNKKPFKIITTQLDYGKTYEGFSKYKNSIVHIQKKKYRSLPLKLFSSLIFILNIKKELKSVTVFNIHNLGLELYFPFFYNKNIIWQVNDLPEVFRVGIHKDQTVTFITRLVQKYLRFGIRHFVKAITVNVTKNKQRIQAIFQKNADVFYCGIEKVDINRNMQNSLERFKSRKINLLSSGVFYPYRNYETQVEVVRILKDKGFDVNLNIIGSTELDRIYAGKMISLINDYHLTDEIKIYGQVSEDYFKQLHADADIFLFVNLDQSWGLAVFEAMSCGLPAIVSKSVGATEILHNDIDAIIVDPLDIQSIANKIERLAQDANNYLRFAKEGIAFSERYTWDNAYSQRMYQLIEEFE